MLEFSRGLERINSIIITASRRDWMPRSRGEEKPQVYCSKSTDTTEVPRERSGRLPSQVT